jgi:hypothetical protein
METFFIITPYIRMLDSDWLIAIIFIWHITWTRPHYYINIKRGKQSLLYLHVKI